MAPELLQELKEAWKPSVWDTMVGVLVVETVVSARGLYQLESKEIIVIFLLYTL